MNDIHKAVAAFRDRLPYATEEQAKAEADRLFAELSAQEEFMTLWRKANDSAKQVRRAEFKTDVDRIWPDDKYG